MLFKRNKLEHARNLEYSSTASLPQFSKTWTDKSGCKRKPIYFVHPHPPPSTNNNEQSHVIYKPIPRRGVPEVLSESRRLDNGCIVSTSVDQYLPLHTAYKSSPSTISFVGNGRKDVVSNDDDDDDDGLADISSWESSKSRRTFGGSLVDVFVRILSRFKSIL
ncbi:hypothetical protein ACOME3_004993 [Neoechinorhynchus agilis]